MLQLNKPIMQIRQKVILQNQNVAANKQVKLNDHNIKIYESLGVRQVYVSNYENKSYSTAKRT